MMMVKITTRQTYMAYYDIYNKHMYNVYIRVYTKIKRDFHECQNSCADKILEHHTKVPKNYCCIQSLRISLFSWFSPKITQFFSLLHFISMIKFYKLLFAPRCSFIKEKKNTCTHISKWTTDFHSTIFEA